MGIDPKLHYCQCGQTFKPGIYHKLLMLFRGEYSWRCPHCQSVSKFRLVYHVVKIGSKPNKDRMELWQRC
jgi:LSD1 subclass zinc finger protein